VTPTPLLALAAAVLQVGRGPERILEIGCGDGDGVFFLAREFPSARVRGLDPSEESVRAAVGRFGLDPEGRVAFKAGDPSSLPYPDEFFDLVVHRTARAHLGEIERVLRRGGDLILITPPSPRLLPRARSGWQQRRLTRHGFQRRFAGDADGEAFVVARLGSAG
jgi:ubiquinone/menaquinone biosynthesis C-methylase UbiE